MNTLLEKAHSLDFFLPLAVFGVVVVAGLIFKYLLFNRLTALAKHTKTKIDDITISAIKGPFITWCVILGVYLGLETSSLSLPHIHLIEKLLMVWGIMSVTFAVAEIATQMTQAYSSVFESALPMTSLTQNIARVIIFIMGIMIVLSNIGVSIAPLLATLGVGGLAVALALQDSLSNLFTGLHLMISRQIKIGDYVRLNTGEEGFIVDINWRTTKLQMLSESIILVPNSKMAQSNITNYYQPQLEMEVWIDYGIHYKNDFKKFERVTLEVAREIVKKIPGTVQEFEPYLRYKALSNQSVDFSVIIKIKSFVDQYLVKHEFIKLILERYEQEGIVIAH